MPEGVTPDHLGHQPAALRRDRPASTMLPDGVIERTYPAEFLDEITIVDTPGTNAIIREHEQLTQQFVPRSDLVLFVTSADRPFTESEREFMERYPGLGQEDRRRHQQDRPAARRRRTSTQVVEFVSENIERLLGFTPGGLPGLGAAGAAGQGARRPQSRRARRGSGRRAGSGRWRSTSSRRSTRRAASGSSCSARSASPSTSPSATCKATDERLAVLRDDVDDDRQHRAPARSLYQEDMRRQFAYHLTRIENIIARMTAARRRVLRGDDPARPRLRPAQQGQDPGRVRAQVVGDTEKQIDAIDRRADRLDGRAGPAHLGSGHTTTSTAAA